MGNYFSIFFWLVLPVLWDGLHSETTKTTHKFTILIDPGHGGRDGGASGIRSKEKEISLKIALQLGTMLRAEMSDIELVYTREKDVFIPLHKRSKMANSIAADLFISIHCNAMPKNLTKVRGAETYVMGLHSSEENLSVAKRENMSTMMEEDRRANYGDFDPNSSEAHIILSMYQNAHLSQSLALAGLIDEQLKTHYTRRTRGVKQAGFLVLRETTMPSVLFEAGYLTNPTDEALLLSEDGQVKTASALFRAIRSYRKQFGPPLPAKNKIDSVKTSDKADDALIKEEKINEENTSKDSDGTYTFEKDETPVFAVQFAMYKPNEAPSTRSFKKLNDVYTYQSGSYLKYVTGQFKTLSEAVQCQKNVRDAGYKDAFVIAFKSGERISIKEALRQL